MLGTGTAVGGGRKGSGIRGARGQALCGLGLRGHLGAVWGLLSRDFTGDLALRYPQGGDVPRNHCWALT